MVLINNLIEFYVQANMVLAKVTDGIAKELLKALQDIIDENVYSYQLTGDWDNRTYEFKNSWTTSVPEWIGGWCESQIDNQSFDFTWSSERNAWSHGNNHKPIESNDDFNEIIDNRQGGSNFGFPALKRPYYDEWLQYIDLNFDRIVKEQCIANDFPVEMATVFYDF